VPGQDYWGAQGLWGDVDKPAGLSAVSHRNLTRTQVITCGVRRRSDPFAAHMGPNGRESHSRSTQPQASITFAAESIVRAPNGPGEVRLPALAGGADRFVSAPTEHIVGWVLVRDASRSDPGSPG
jgi:hypothetical protein